MTRQQHQSERRGGRRFELVLGVVAGLVCLAAMFALLQLVIAVSNARAYSEAAASPGEMRVTYAGLEAPLAAAHPGMRAPGRMCIVALEDGGTRYAARLAGGACQGLRAGSEASVMTWHGRVIAVDGWATGDQPRGAVVAWSLATAVLGFVGAILTAAAVRAAGNRRPSWYYEHLKR